MKVTIKCKQTILYNQEVEMSEEDYEVINNLDFEDVDNLQPEYEILERYIDTTDVFDIESEYTDVQISIPNN